MRFSAIAELLVYDMELTQICVECCCMFQLIYFLDLCNFCNKMKYFLQFLSELTRFFQKSKASSKSVQLTMKKCNKPFHVITLRIFLFVYLYQSAE